MCIRDRPSTKSSVSILSDVQAKALNLPTGRGQVYQQDKTTNKIDLIEGTVAPASENLVSGNFVNKYDNAGSLNIRKADATTNAKPANGFVLANVTSPANATVYTVGSKNNTLSALTIGVDYWLSTTPGGITTTAPSATGNWVQEVGKSDSATALIFTNEKFGWTKV